MAALVRRNESNEGQSLTAKQKKHFETWSALGHEGGLLNKVKRFSGHLENESLKINGGKLFTKNNRNPLGGF